MPYNHTYLSALAAITALVTSCAAGPDAGPDTPSPASAQSQTHALQTAAVTPATSPETIVPTAHDALTQARDLESAGKTRDAIRLLTAFLDARGDDTGVRTALAGTLARNGQVYDALHHYERLAGGDWKAAKPAILARLAQTYFAAHNPARARAAQQAYLDALRASPTAKTRCDRNMARRMMAVALADMAEYAYWDLDETAAQAALRESFAEVPTATGHYVRQWMAVRAGDLATAATDLEALKASLPDHPGVLNALSIYEYLRGDDEASMAYLERGIEVTADGDDRGLAVLLSNLAELHFNRGDASTAELYFQYAVGAYDDDPRLLITRAIVEDIQGRADAAADAVEAALDLDESGRAFDRGTVFRHGEWRAYGEALMAEARGEDARAAKLWQTVARGNLANFAARAREHLKELQGAPEVAVPRVETMRPAVEPDTHRILNTILLIAE